MSKSLPIVAIVGRPNVGKSSLFNAMLGERRAIVENTPGTTRDPVQGIINYNRKNLWLVDTAGIQTPDNELELSIQEQVAEAIATADLLVIVVEATTLVTDQDRKAAKLALKSQKPIILAVNKIDQTANKLPNESVKLGIKDIIGTSSTQHSGISELLDIISTQTPEQLKTIDYKATFALLGRPNVGKSSLFNAIIKDNKAIVNQTAGTTRDVNRTLFKHHGSTYQLLDTAGIRRRAKQQKGVEYFSLLRTTVAITEANVCYLVIDATEPSVALDQKIASLVKEADKGLILLVNKWDLLKGDDKAISALNQRIQHDFQFVWWAPLIYTSTVSNHNISRIIDPSLSIIKHQNMTIETKQLNNLLQRAVTKHPPAGLKNRHPKLKYVTQTGTNPPEFTFFGSQVDFLHWSYKRYLETQLRESYDFIGTPIRLRFSSKYKT